MRINLCSLQALLSATLLAIEAQVLALETAQHSAVPSPIAEVLVVQEVSEVNVIDKVRPVDPHSIEDALPTDTNISRC